jgi:hypothetical protein
MDFDLLDNVIANPQNALGSSVAKANTQLSINALW